jgi:hypothetical protein
MKHIKRHCPRQAKSYLLLLCKIYLLPILSHSASSTHYLFNLLFNETGTHYVARLALSLQSCLSLPSAGIIGIVPLYSPQIYVTLNLN